MSDTKPKPRVKAKKLAPMTSMEFSVPVHEWIEKESAKRGWTKKHLLETAVRTFRKSEATR